MGSASSIQPSIIGVATENPLFDWRCAQGRLDLMNWRSVRLELDSTCDFPAGSVSRAYLLRLPLDDFDMVDPKALARYPSRATVRRHWSTEPDENGLVVKGGEHWSIRSNGKDRRLCLDLQPVRLGGRMSVVETDGTVLPFKIASVR